MQIKHRANIYTRKPRHFFKQWFAFYAQPKIPGEELKPGKAIYPSDKGVGIADSFLDGTVSALKAKGLKVYYENIDGTKGAL